MARKGRKRKNKERHKNGRLKWSPSLPSVDRGTEEQQRMRQLITGDQRLSPDYPLSILLGRGLITELQHDTGMRFARQCWSLFGKPFGKAQDYQQPKGGGMGVAAELQARADYEAALAVLSELGAVSLIVDLAVHLHRGWLVDAIVMGEKRYRRHALQLDRIRTALDALASLPSEKVSKETKDRAEQEAAA